RLANVSLRNSRVQVRAELRQRSRVWLVRASQCGPRPRLLRLSSNQPSPPAKPGSGVDWDDFGYDYPLRPSPVDRTDCRPRPKCTNRPSTAPTDFSIFDAAAKLQLVRVTCSLIAITGHSGDCDGVTSWSICCWLSHPKHEAGRKADARSARDHPCR